MGGRAYYTSNFLKVSHFGFHHQFFFLMEMRRSLSRRNDGCCLHKTRIRKLWRKTFERGKHTQNNRRGKNETRWGKNCRVNSKMDCKWMEKVFRHHHIQAAERVRQLGGRERRKRPAGEGRRADPIPFTELFLLRGVIGTQFMCFCAECNDKSCKLKCWTMIMDTLELRMREVFSLRQAALDRPARSERINRKIEPSVKPCRVVVWVLWGFYSYAVACEQQKKWHNTKKVDLNYIPAASFLCTWQNTLTDQGSQWNHAEKISNWISSSCQTHNNCRELVVRCCRTWLKI